MFNSWIFWVAFFLIWNVILLVVKRIMADRWPANVKVLDLNLPLMVCGLHFLSHELLGLSILPFLIFALALFGIAMTLMYALLEGDIIYRAFFVRYLRITDIVALTVFLFFLVVKVVE